MGRKTESAAESGLKGSETGRENGTAASLRVLLIDHHEIVRLGFRQVLPDLVDEGGALSLVEADSFSAAEALLTRQDAVERLDLVLLDTDLPDAGSSRLSLLLRTERPAVPVVILSAAEDWQRAAEFLHAGVQGFLPTSSRTDVMVNALRLVMSGGRYFPAQVFEALCTPGAMQTQALLEGNGNENVMTDVLAADIHLPGLSPRQQEVLMRMIAGRSNKEIAREMNLSVGTVKNYVAIILRVFNTSSRSKAVFAASAAIRNRSAEAA